MGWGTSQVAGEGKRLSLIKMILLRHLIAGFEKKGGDCRFDCDDYRPDTLGGNYGNYLNLPSAVIVNDDTT